MEGTAKYLVFSSVGLYSRESLMEERRRTLLEGSYHPVPVHVIVYLKAVIVPVEREWRGYRGKGDGG